MMPQLMQKAAHNLNVRITGMPQGNLRIGQKAIISVRPEKLRLVPETPHSIQYQLNDQNQIKVKIVNTTYIGSDTRILVQAGDHYQLKVWEQNRISTLDPQAYYAEGQDVFVTVLPVNVLVLPEDSP